MKFLRFIPLIPLLALAQACSSPTVLKVSPTTEKPTSTVPVVACPLTGLQAPKNAVPSRPAIAIKVDNYPNARPQSGLNNADIVFEEPVEGFITRYVAVFQCQSPPQVGPVRSARLIDVGILDELSKPIFIHVGGIDPVVSAVYQANDIEDNLFTHSQLQQNPPGRYAPYDTYVVPSQIWQLNSSDTLPPAPIFNYAFATPTGQKVSSVNIDYSPTNNGTWTWNGNSWVLSYQGATQLDASGTPINAANIVVERESVTFGPWVENAQGGLEVVAFQTGTGKASVFRNGIEVDGTWSRPSLNGAPILTDSNGNQIPLNPGRTWVEIVPDQVSITVS
ncbi:MAG: DUF3048 domain-containing protein [Acidimicrobiales bacterium]|nr:DUF3048 domain-containing protein [Acidimicrobiales bacterium]